MNWTKFEGIMAGIFTPMNEDGSVNLDMVEPYAQHLQQMGMKGIFLNGTTGEEQSLTTEERKAMAEAWMKHGRDKFDRIIIQCGAGHLLETKELIRHAAQIGADCVAVIGPTYFKPSTIPDVVSYCAEAAQEAPNTPFMFYYYPGISGTRITIADFLTEAHETMPTLVGVKFSAFDLHDVFLSSTMFNGKYEILFGADWVMLPALSIGMKGFVGLTYGMTGKACNRMLKAFQQGNLDAAREEQLRIIQLLTQVAPGMGYAANEQLAAFKATFTLCFPKIQLGPTRKPIAPITASRLKEIQKNLEASGLKEWMYRD